MIIKASDVKSASLKSSFSKYDSMLVKGVAVILLMYLHCIANEQVPYKSFEFDYFPFNSVYWPNLICSSFKLCVGMFVFITGYGLFKSFSKIEDNPRTIYNWTGTRLIKVMSGYWIVYILTIIITYAIDEFPVYRYVTTPTNLEGSWLYAIIDFLGLAHLFGTPTMIGTWWYMSAIVVMIVFFAALYKAGEKFGYLLLAIMLVLLPRIIGQGFPGGRNILSFALAYIAGMVFAKYDVFSKVEKFSLFGKSKTKKLISDIVMFFVFMGAFALIVIISDRFDVKYVWEFNYCISPIIIIIFCKMYFSRIPVLNQILMFIGSHSLNIFLIHTFLRYVYLRDFIYSLKYTAIFPLVLLAMTLAISVVIELFKKLIHYDMLASKIIKKFFSKEEKKVQVQADEEIENKKI